MDLNVIIIAFIGLLAGGLVNALADELPYRRNPTLPTYPNGAPRPISAWLGIIAFPLGQRTPSDTAESNEGHRRHYEGEPKLGWRYPITEVSTAILMVLTYVIWGNDPEVSSLQMIIWLIYMAIFMLINVIDIEHKLILFIVMIPSAILALLDASIVPIPAPLLKDALIGGGVGFVIFFIFYQGGYLFTYIMGRARGETINTVAFGFGDVMMITLSGLILGLQGVIFVMFISVFLGAVGAIVYLLLMRFVFAGRYSLFTAIPYGPYIVAATIIVLLFPDEMSLLLLGYVHA
jgi:leader peptidase (prepilin peptidase) / N-methyltransferase